MKTHLACTIASELARKNNGIGIVINTIEDLKFDIIIDQVRINNPDRLLIFVLDELEKNGRYELRNSDFLAFLDGAKSRENVIILATVNSIKDFPDFLIQRPGRFEKIYDFVFNTEEVLGQLIKELVPKQYKEKKELLKDITLRAIVGNIKTIDELRFLILDYLVTIEDGKPLSPIPKGKSVIIEELKTEDKTDMKEKEFIEIVSEEFAADIKSEEISFTSEPSLN